MRRTEQVKGLRIMKFEEIHERTTSRLLSQHEAASILGISERTFRRWPDRYEAEGVEGLHDRRLGRPSGRRVPVDAMMAMLALFDTRCWHSTAKHFWEKLASEHGFSRSYNWVRLTLQEHGRIQLAPRRGPNRRRRERRPLPGRAMKWPERAGSSHQWVPANGGI